MALLWLFAVSKSWIPRSLRLDTDRKKVLLKFKTLKNKQTNKQTNKEWQGI